MNPVSQNCRANDENYDPKYYQPRQKNHLVPWHQTCSKIHNNIHSSSTGLSEENMVDDTQKDWRDLCVAVTNEKDSRKLISLIRELVEALDRGERDRRHPSSPPDAIDTHRQESRVATVCVSA